MKRTITHYCALALATVSSLAATALASESKVVDVVHIRGGSSYMEIRVSQAVCTTGGISASWGEKPRIDYSYPERAQSVQSLATTAMLSARKLKVYATTSGSGADARCKIDYVLLLND